ncbi:hypothetical protein K505DRAFT_380015 [Melanomma pulvis-pyrius CBS 109.77]|uniref:Uncharacterized protein n=1 Tax=Melanomma pulvis-pyrius CBS 109.77 TaxID=1314802 RepID=A0A6A6WRU8_9PLEO|nr:hypothetical protein K505DRAFT_380015 [Melanomma pulvis-pyrius CBS 109.77]
MSTSQLHGSSLLDRTNHQEPAHDPNSAPYPTNAAAWDVADLFNSQVDLGRVHSQDPFAYYKAYLHTSESSPYGASDAIDDANACHPISHPSQIIHCAGDQQPVRARPVPYHVAVRLANRATGVPLSTIIEQGSYSTLNSHESPRSVGRYPLIKINDTILPSKYPHRASRSLDETTLRKIEENTHQEQHSHEDVALHAALGGDGGILDSPCTAATLIKLSLYARQLSGSSQTPATESDLESKGLKGFFRGVLQHARGARNDGSRSSSVTNTPPHENRIEGLDTKEDSSRAQHQCSEFTSTRLKTNARGVSTLGNSLPSSFSSSQQILPQIEARYHTSVSRDRERSARVYPSAASKSDAESSSPHFLQPPHSSLSSSSPPSSEQVLSTTPRDIAREYSLAETCTPSHRSNDDLSAQHTSDIVPICKTNAPSLREYDRAREASICSTVSTTYSGTVLGIDLDLQQGYPLVARRSPTPVWIASSQVSGSQPGQNKVTINTPRSITSSALPVLLPLAAASGIVRPNHATPRVSFFSPSGNLIQAEDSSSQTTNSSHYRSSPMTDYDNILSNPVYEPSIRPTLIPLTTPPTPTARLPAHMRCHHNNQHPTHSHIVPKQPQLGIKFAMATGADVKGCGGIIRANSLQPRSGMKQPGSTRKNRRSNRSSPCSFHSHALGSDKLASCVGQPSLQFQNCIAMERRRGRIRKEGHTKAESGARKAHRTPSRPLGARAAHALRVCFCQPWDGDNDEVDAHVGPYSDCKGTDRCSRPS